MKIVLLLCASLLTSTAFAFKIPTPPSVNDNEGTSRAPVFNAETLDTVTSAAVCPCNIPPNQPSGLVSDNRGQSAPGSARILPPAATAVTPGTNAPNKNAEKPASRTGG